MQLNARSVGLQAVLLIRTILGRSITSLAVAMLVTACVPLPIPHKAVRNSSLSGQVIDDQTGHPIHGVSVSLDTPGSFYRTVEVSTDNDGKFKMDPATRWGFLWIIAFLPFEQLSCRDTLRFAGPAPGLPGVDEPYRDLRLAVRSCPPEPLLFYSAGDNRKIRDDVGIVRMKRLPQPAQGADSPRNLVE